MSAQLAACNLTADEILIWLVLTNLALAPFLGLMAICAWEWLRPLRERRAEADRIEEESRP